MSVVSKGNVRNDVIDNAMISYYALDGVKNGTKSLFDVISGKGFENWFSEMFNKSSDTISSLRAYPVKSKYLGFSDTLGSNTWIGGEARDIKSRTLKNITETCTIAKYKFLKANSFTDLSPYTQVQLYIPYMDFIDLPINELVGNTLIVKYVVDLPSGIATAYIHVNVTKTNRYHLIAVKNAKLGVDLAWGKDNSVENTRNIINTAISTTISLATMYATAGASAVPQAIISARAGSEVGKGALSVVNSLQTRYERGGSAGSYTSLFSPSSCYLIIKKPKLVPVNENDYLRVYGKPLYESRVLAQVTGYTVVDDIHLTGLSNAYDEEVNEIERLLKSGVHL